MEYLDWLIKDLEMAIDKIENCHYEEAIDWLNSTVSELKLRRPTLRAVDPPSALVGGGDSENSAGN